MFVFKEMFGCIINKYIYAVMQITFCAAKFYDDTISNHLMLESQMKN
jgi:hypothetical protein